MAKFYQLYQASKPVLRRLNLGLAIIIALSSGAYAQCYGVNLFNELNDQDKSSINSRTKATPHAAGNFWRLRKDDKLITVIGTYHLDDPRHSATLEAAAPLIASAGALLVEAGPEEERALLQEMNKKPDLMMITTGPSLLEQLGPDRWDKVAKAFQARNIPAFIGAKFQPWYASMVLGLPPCAMIDGQIKDGLDAQLIKLAQEFDRPLVALESHKTLFSLFDQLSAEDAMDMLETSLAMEDRSQDYTSTLADMYFSGESRMIWELTRHLFAAQPHMTPEKVDKDMAQMEHLLMATRNQAWIPVIEAASAQYSAPLVVAFGALHLSGENGVLELLAKNGWQLERIEL